MAQPKSPVHEEFGARVRDRRDALGITQEQLAELSGLHMTYVGQVERGECNIALTNILRIAHALETDPGILMAGLEPPPAG
jgi:transcriptional regulator with XRE-family HTH domain